MKLGDHLFMQSILGQLSSYGHFNSHPDVARSRSWYGNKTKCDSGTGRPLMDELIEPMLAVLAPIELSKKDAVLA